MFLPLAINPAFSETRTHSLEAELSRDGPLINSSLKHSFNCWSLAHAINAVFPETASSTAPDLSQITAMEYYYAAKTNRELFSRNSATQAFDDAASLSDFVNESVGTYTQILNNLSDPPSIELPEEGTGFSSVEDMRLSIQIRYCYQKMDE